MFGTLLSNELNKFAECAGTKKKTPVLPTDVKLKKMAQLSGKAPPPKPVTPSTPENPESITPGAQPPPKPITPATLDQLFQPQKASSLNNLGQKMASFQGDNTMNMFGVLVNMELQKLAAPKTIKELADEAKKKNDATTAKGSNVFGVAGTSTNPYDLIKR
jgi:hypothetical protein